MPLSHGRSGRVGGQTRDEHTVPAASLRNLAWRLDAYQAFHRPPQDPRGALHSRRRGAGSRRRGRPPRGPWPVRNPHLRQQSRGPMPISSARSRWNSAAAMSSIRTSNTRSFPTLKPKRRGWTSPPQPSRCSLRRAPSGRKPRAFISNATGAGWRTAPTGSPGSGSTWHASPSTMSTGRRAPPASSAPSRQNSIR